MSDPEPIGDIMNRMKRKYDQDKHNWNVVSNQDKDGNREMLVNHDPNTWWLKMRQINPLSYLSAGKELHNIDEEINQKIGKQSKVDPEKELLQLFGMMTPTKKDIIYTSGIERYSPPLVKDQIQKIEEKNPDLDKNFRQHIRKKWEKEYYDRDALYQ
jgi:hypothetical protein